jgi:basic membrane protein A
MRLEKELTMFTKKKRLIFVLVVTIILSSLMFGCATKPEDTTADGVYKIAFVSDQAFDASEWLQNLVVGLNQYKEENEGVEIKLVEATLANEYEPKVRAVAEEGYDLIITSYDSMASATISVANDFPNIKFASLQGMIENISQYKNIEEFKLNRPQTAYLAGIVAGMMTEKNLVGIVGGADVGGINEIIAGWQQGMRRVNPEIEDIVVYSNTFTDPTIGKELGLSLVAKGADIIAAAAGGTGVGTAQAAAESEVHFVAWDVHYQDVLGGLELGSAVNYFEKMFILYIDDVRSGKYEGGVLKEYGIADGVCDFEILENSPAFQKEILDEIALAKEEIGSGKVVVSGEPLHK